MELVFVYEDKIAQDAEGNYYVGSAFSQAVFERYLRHFDSITLLMRRAKVDPHDERTLARWNRIDTARINVVLLPDLWDGFSSFLSIKKQREFKRIVEENIRPERAVVIRAPSSAGYIAAKKCRKMGKPYLAEAVGCPWDSLTNHSLKGKVMAPAAWLKMRYCMKHAGHALYVTSEFLQRRYPSGGKRAAISDVQLGASDDTVLLRRLDKIRAHEGKTLVGTAAAVNVAFKGQRYVIEALAKLKAEGRSDFEYHLVGGGDNSALNELAKKLGVSEQVVFEGSLPHDKMFDWLDELDIYVQPSLQEGLPRALVEAMSRGLPAIATNIGGMPELLGSGAIVPRKDPEAIACRLAGTGTEALLERARENFSTAAGFQRETLEQKRFEFYADFASASKESI